MTERQLPQNLDAERSVLGSVFIKPSCFAIVASMLVADTFFLPNHREIFSAMGEVERRGMAIDPIAVTEELKARDALSRLDGGESYLMTLMTATPTAENVDTYARIVLDTSNRRKVIALCGATTSRAYSDSVTGEELVEGLGSDLARVIRQTARKTPLIGDVIPLAMAEIERRAEAGPEKSFSGMRSGVRALDEITWGWEAPDLVVIGADPGGGKTALAGQAALIATIQDDWVGFCANLEMSAKQLTERALVRRAKVNSYYVRRGDLQRDAFSDLLTAAQEIAPATLYVEDSITTIEQYELMCRLFRTKHPSKKAFGIFDYVQLADAGANGQGQRRDQQVGGLVRRLKKLAKELDMVQIAISSLNRDQKDVAERPPTMKNLKESGDVEYAADTVHLIWNKTVTDDGEVDILTVKNRKGPKGTVPAWFRGRHYAFLDVGDVDMREPVQPSLLT